ncbi:hypothetical protein RJ639_008607 [Escallonia herrerae]|uniref:Pre-PUA domain-containing protein n=1 Tax=Escallonia herrerae TaxID=1293975 RepID=A0AA89ASP1_9ASTE|nr:hypothetical protein RJ639_008607 [Escallonia herrerae]
MFKKWVEPKSQQRLSGADRKKLKRSIKDRFRNASDADIDVLLPPKACLSESQHCATPDIRRKRSVQIQIEGSYKDVSE